MNYDDEINEIRKGFEMFDVENKGQIDPFELKETMEEMNLKEKNPFIYELISSLCQKKEIKSKGGLTSDEFISYLEEKISDVDTKKGIKTIFDVFSDSDNKVPMPAFYQAAKEVGDDEGGAEIRDLVEKSKTGGKEIDFDEFYDIMKEKNPFMIYNRYSHKRNTSGNSHKSNKSLGKSSDKRESHSEYDRNSYRSKNTSRYSENTNDQKRSVVIVEKIITEQVNDNPMKISRYHLRQDDGGKDNRVERKENYTYQYKNHKLDEENNNEEVVEAKRYHRKFRENKKSTEN